MSVQGRFWRSGKLQHDFRFDKISDYLAEPDTLVWADVCDPDHEALSELADELGLIDGRSRSASAAERGVKATNYPTHTFLTIYGIPVPEPELRRPVAAGALDAPGFSVRARKAGLDHRASHRRSTSTR